MLTRFRSAVITLASITVRNLPRTISARLAGLISRVSIVPRSFSPAHRSIGRVKRPGQRHHDQQEREEPAPDAPAHLAARWPRPRALTWIGSV